MRWCYAKLWRFALSRCRAAVVNEPDGKWTHVLGDLWTCTKRLPHVTDKTVERCEELVGMGHRAWDMVDPKELIVAAWTAAQERHSGRYETIED